MALREGVKRQGERREERLQARVRPVTVERKRGAHYTFGESSAARPRHHGRGADAPGPAVRHGLHHRHAPARAHPSRRRWWSTIRPRAQRAGEAVRHPFPRADAADPDHLRPRGDPRVPREHKDIIVKPLFGNGGAGVFRIKPDDENLAALLEMHFAALAASR